MPPFNTTSLAVEGILERGSKLITNSRQPGTTSNYELSWQKWVGWCGEQKIDQHACHVVLLTINSHRPAISAYHDLVDNMPIAQTLKCVH